MNGIRRHRIFPLLALLAVLSAAPACAQTAAAGQPLTDYLQSASPVNKAPTSAKLLPEDDRILLIVGQDLTSVYAYVDSGRYPTPGGVVTYLSFYNLLSESHPAYGALGEDPAGKPLTYDADWGAGRLNAHTAARGFPDSALVIGLNIAEGSGDTVWAGGGLAAIGRGDHDDKIRRLARFCRDAGKPVYLRIGYEFDGAWNRGYENSTAYVEAFRRIVDVMRAADAGRVAYVWQASASPIDDIIDGSREDIADWYPGDDYVDWAGLSWFLRPDEKPAAAPSQRELADEIIGFARARGKPVMIAEAAPQGYDLDRSTVANIGPLWDGDAGQLRSDLSATRIWQEWFEAFFAYITANADVIRAVTYINADWDSQPMWAAPYPNGYWGDSRIQVNPVISERWLQQIGDDNTWLHGSPDIAEKLND